MSMSKSSWPPSGLILLLAALTHPAFAGDGVVEISQACAVTTGCLAGDSPGLPVTIGASGSYRLTGDLQIDDASTTALSITTADVTVDLNGFGIYGPTVCADGGDGTVACDPVGNGDGIRASSLDGTGVENVTVRNGTVRGMGRSGVSLNGNESRIESMRARSNGQTGLAVNGPTLAGGGSVVSSSSFQNGLDGIFIGFDGLARGNTAVANGRNGIRANERSTVLDNTLTRNKNTGLNVSTASGYANNVLSANNGGNLNPQVSGSGVEIGGNLCGVDTTCP